MTPREQSTLDLILRSVEHYNGKSVKGVRVVPTLMLDTRCPGMPLAGCPAVVLGDYMIGKVEFRPTGAQCA
jgi:hypothetical protein